MTNPLYSSDALNTASDTDYSVAGDAYDGTPTKIAPLLATVQQGIARPAKQAAAQYFNWLTSQFAQILGALIADVSHEHSQTFLTSGSWTAPNDGYVKVIGCGGGGGGGGGGNGRAAGDVWQAGGGGGGGAVLGEAVFAVTAGQIFAIVIGAGGAGAPSGAADGTSGSPSSIFLSATPIVQFVGGGGGMRGREVNTTIADFAFGRGGPVIAGMSAWAFTANADPNYGRTGIPQEGGSGVTSNNAARRVGNPSLQGWAGGAAGSNGTDASGTRAGGAGGGGGAGPFGNGSPAGSGGNGNGSGSGGAGGPANVDASANTGAGGAGGGGGGCGTSGTSAGGYGAAGGSGRLTLVWTEYGTQ